MKPPDTDPPAVTQAPEVTKPAEEGLEKTQVVSVGRKPEPLMEICKPTRPVPELNAITGEESTFVSTMVFAEANKTQMKINAASTLNGTQTIYSTQLGNSTSDGLFLGNQLPKMFSELLKRELGVLVGSHGFFEIVCLETSAARILTAKIGDDLRVGGA